MVTCFLGVGCENSAEPATDTSAEDVAVAKSSLAIQFASGDSATSVTQDITLPAKVGDVSVTWSSSNSYVVSNNGSVTRPSYIDGDTSVILTAVLSKGVASDTKDFTLIILAIGPYSYTVIFDSQNADTDASPSSITVTEPVTKVSDLPIPPTKEGFEFDGWFTEENGGGTVFTTSTVITGDITVYAKWIAVTPVTPIDKIAYAIDNRGNLMKRSLFPNSSWENVDSSSSYNLSAPESISISN